MHDTVNLEQRGLPMVFVASSEFEDAAEAQASALGFDAARVFVPHPIQDRTDEEVKEIARNAIEDILQAICQ